MPAEDKPAFEVIAPDGRYFRIWASGKTEGFPEASVTMNRIPQLLGKAVGDYKARLAALING